MIWFCFSPFPIFAIDSSGFLSSPYFYYIFFWLWLLSIRYAYVWWLSKEAIETEASSRDSFGFIWTPLGFPFCDMKSIQQFQWPMASNSRWGCSELSSQWVNMAVPKTIPMAQWPGFVISSDEMVDLLAWLEVSYVMGCPCSSSILDWDFP